MEIEAERIIEEHRQSIKILEYKKYKSSIELYGIVNVLRTFFDSNEFFREYCKKIRISHYLLNIGSSDKRSYDVVRRK
jgi:hypothetical protein